MSKPRIFHPDKDFSDHAMIRNIPQYQYICQQAEEDFEGFWKLLADTKLDWIKPYEQVLNETDAPFYKWFTHGKLND